MIEEGFASTRKPFFNHANLVINWLKQFEFVRPMPHEVTV